MDRCGGKPATRKLRGQRYAVMVHDIYPDILVRVAGYSERHPLIRLWYWLNRPAYERTDVVMTLGEHMAANLERQFDSRKTRVGKVEVVYPWVDAEKIKPIPKEENWFAQKYGQVGRLTVMYAGNMGLGHDLESMVEAARHLSTITDVHFLFVGAGPKWTWIDETIRCGGLENVTLLPWQPEESLPWLLATADVSLVSLKTAMTGMAIPSKAIYALAAGAALLVLADE